MKVLEPQSAVLSNAEVLAHLNDIAIKRRSEPNQKKALKSPNFETVVRELTSSLAPAGSSPVPPYSTHYDAHKIHDLVQSLAEFNLTKAELLMILNLRPQEAVFLDIIVEECDSRLDEGAQTLVLETINTFLGAAA